MRQIKSTRDIQPVSEFRANAAKFLDQVRETKKPLVITQHGRGAAVLLDMESYEDMLEELLDRRAIMATQAAAREGTLIDNEVVMQDLRERYGV